MSSSRISGYRCLNTASFTAAAKRLGLAQSGVSRSVRELEERLGVQLLVRTTRKLSLT
ncbi:LysR family transcriptional regulator, partial [Escherichia coli]|nr:LysR family transcriptional regulator [Escherichia coli]